VNIPLDQLPAEFDKWILATGLRDLIEALEPFLEEGGREGLSRNLKTEPKRPKLE
jgi:hypothetical protein